MFTIVRTRNEVEVSESEALLDSWIRSFARSGPVHLPARARSVLLRPARVDRSQRRPHAA